jgi:hypothetical protein
LGWLRQLRLMLFPGGLGPEVVFHVAALGASIGFPEPVCYELYLLFSVVVFHPFAPLKGDINFLNAIAVAQRVCAKVGAGTGTRPYLSTHHIRLAGQSPWEWEPERASHVPRHRLES